MGPCRWSWIVILCIISLGFVATQWGCQPAESPPEPAPRLAGPGAAPEAEPAAETEAEPGAEPEPMPTAEAETESATEPEAEPAAKPAVEKEAEEPAELAAAAETPGATIAPPLGLPPVPVPADNPITPEKVALGKMLYFDTRLSKDGTISCATCHDPEMAWAEHTPTSKGIGDQMGGANAPTVINAAYATSQFWDGRAASLEEQALGPIQNPIEMGHTMEALMIDLEKISDYGAAFEKTFGDSEITEERIAQAIASFERLVLSGNSPYDKFKAGQQDALNEAQKRGMQRFEDVGCSTCHAPPVFSNYRFYNAGVGMDKDPPDPGRKTVTGKDSDQGKFRVPALREVANTHPYFHDGSVATLEEAVALMAGGGNDNPKLSPMLKALREAEISEQDQKDIVEALKALSGDYPRKDDI